MTYIDAGKKSPIEFYYRAYCFVTDIVLLCDDSDKLPWYPRVIFIMPIMWSIKVSILYHVCAVILKYGE